MSHGPEQLAQALGQLEERLDWEALGHLYCDEGGEAFFSEEAREAIFDAGLHLASDLADALAHLPAGEGRGRSLYVGAAIAELPVILCESLVLGRKVVCAGPASAEREALNRALEATEKDLGLRLPRFGQEGVPRSPRASFGSFGHVWLVSVLNDPEAFPALHDALYGRSGTELATGRGDRRIEQGRAEDLVERLLACLDPPAVWTTTDEELPLIAPLAEELGWRLVTPEQARLSGIVGDPVRVCQLSRHSRSR